MIKKAVEVTKILRYLRPNDVDANLGELTERMGAKGFVLGSRADVQRYGNSYVRFTFDKAQG